uniref:SAP domain containing ribonucleoprotein n=1 Tax=Capra hircus TaxID=9925 RepID=A0A452EG98_CAPHI
EIRETVILSNLLAELKQECLARGLETKGIKQDLINRLQAYLEEHGRRTKALRTACQRGRTS